METQTHETTPILLAVRSFRINVAQEALVDAWRRHAGPARVGERGTAGTRYARRPPPHMAPAMSRST